MSWFETKVKYLKVDEISGKEKKVTESYLVDAVSFTEAEKRINEEMEPVISGDFTVTALKTSNITEVIPSEADAADRWYKAKVTVTDIDDVSGKEKKSNQYFLVEAPDIKGAQKILEEELEEYLIPWDIPAVNDTLFMDVFPYFENKEELPPNLKKMESLD